MEVRDGLNTISDYYRNYQPTINTSNSTITVGHMPVKPNQSVTIGTFGNRKAHTGIWYNIEGSWY